MIEILFEEICNLYGDQGNVNYLEQNFDNIIKTSYIDEPYFVKNEVKMIYLGPMSENNKIKVLNKLKPYKERIKELIDKNVIFLFTGNSFEILGKTIKTNNNEIIEGLNLLDIETIENQENRYNSLYLGKFNDIEIVGYKSQSSNSIINEKPLFETIREENNSKNEGLRKNNFFGTNLLGPILILNPYFTKYIFKLLNKDDILYEEELIDAYNKRLEEYKSDIKYH